MLMGHMNMRIKHYNDHDYRIAEHRQKNLPHVISEFKKAIDELTIDENYKLKKHIKILKENVANQPNIEEMQIEIQKVMQEKSQKIAKNFKILNKRVQQLREMMATISSSGVT